VHEVLDGEFPIHAPFRYAQWVPNSTMSAFSQALFSSNCQHLRPAYHNYGRKSIIY
jgi:hypothetical protein